MRKYLSVLTIALLCLFIWSCNKNKAKGDEVTNEPPALEKADREISSISALYYNYTFENSKRLNPEDVVKSIPQFKMDRKGVLDAEITDTTKLNKIQVLLDLLQPSSEQHPIDARIVATIHYKDGSKDTLCLSGIYSNRIYMNGIEQSGDNELLFVVKNYIGFYPWMIGDDMFEMVEMKDNSFPKAPFISTPYYKEYQAALASK